ncbi:hypothetical protein F511_29597 [Dorcoceras hygrometricum]|uniref:Uncharacterized protein n=1 Tax=Dorcoceras hygrometricum TaxID=472368 RepID=A0A2Z7ADY0_9LAMI|nr:hypothetical protein F511_29597 [Dorcoceras hygrometricum]
MAQYQILARKPLGPSGTGPKQTLEVKTVSNHRLGFAARRRTAACTACGAVPHAARATARNSCTRWRPAARTARANPSLCSVTTVGAAVDLDPVSQGAAEAPGSDQFHRETGTSKVGGGRYPNPVHEWKQDSRQPALEDLTNLPRTESPRRCDRNKSNHVSNGGGGRRVEERRPRGGSGEGGGGLVSRVFVMLKKSHSLNSSSYAQHIELNFRERIVKPVLVCPQWFRDTASRGLTTFATPKSQFRTDPSDHGKAPSNIAP